MRKFTVLGAIVIAAMFALCAPQPAGAFISNQNGIATAAHATTNTIEVKRSLQKGTPPSWHHGKKRAGTDAEGLPGKCDATGQPQRSIAGQHDVLQDRIDLVLPALA
jgi:hypothetical protein